MPPEPPADALTDVVTRLEAAEVAYMVTGSVAGALYGVMRTPADLDVVVDLAHGQVAALVAAFAGDYYVELDAAFDAVERQSMFNVIPLKGGMKADLIILSDEPFQQTAFARRQQADSQGTLVWTIAPADLVLNKLRWAQITYSDQQLADVRAIMASGFVEEDDEFRGWVRRLRLEDLLDASRATRYDA